MKEIFRVTALACFYCYKSNSKHHIITRSCVVMYMINYPCIVWISLKHHRLQNKSHLCMYTDNTGNVNRIIFTYSLYIHFVIVFVVREKVVFISSLC